MPAIDLHAHVFLRETLERMQAEHPDRSPRLVQVHDGYMLEFPSRSASGPFPASMFDVEQRLADMDLAEVDVQVLSVPPPLLHYHLDPPVGAAFARIQNDVGLALSLERPDRFQWFATLPLQDRDASLRELERLADASVVRGIQVGSNVNGASLVPTCDWLWKAASELDLPIWVHPDRRAVTSRDGANRYHLGNLVGIPHETTLAIGELIFSGVLDRYPDLRLGFVHGGGFAPYQIGRWDHGWSNRDDASAEIDEPPSTYLRRMFFDSLTHDRLSLRLLGDRVGWSQVVIGSDYPFDMSDPRAVQAIRNLSLSPQVETAVLRENARRFLRRLDDRTR